MPMRTCVVCRQNLPKRDLLRVVRPPDGAVTLDPTGKLAGRGAYLCRRRACWDEALKKKSLDRALNTSLGDEERSRLAAFAASLPDIEPPMGDPVK